MTTWLDRLVFQTPREERIYLERALVPDATCPACGSSDVRRYPIANHKGARMATKCQACMHVLKVERPAFEDNWPPFRAVAYDWEASPSERASRDRLDRERTG